jgi:hypothetical protein
MIGHDDGHGVDIRPVQKLTKINVGVAALELAAGSLLGVMLVDPLPRGFPSEDLVGVVVTDAAPIHVANGRHSDVVVDQQRRHNPLALVPAADEAHVNPMARRIGPPHARGHQGGNAEGTRGRTHRLQKPAAGAKAAVLCRTVQVTHGGLSQQEHRRDVESTSRQDIQADRSSQTTPQVCRGGVARKVASMGLAVFGHRYPGQRVVFMRDFVAVLARRGSTLLESFALGSCA